MLGVMPPALGAPWRGVPGCISSELEIFTPGAVCVLSSSLPFMQCSVRVKTDPKLMNNPEAQCTAFYLDFFKCADACVRPKH